MGRQKLFPPKAPADDRRKPHDRFKDLAKKIVTVKKSEIDEREKRWRAHKEPKG